RYLTDVFDYAGDCARRPDRPLPSGVVSRFEASAFGFGLLALGSGLLLPLGVGPFASGLLLAALILGYDLWHKTNPLSPVVMAACRVMVYVTAYLVFAPASLTEPVGLVVPCLLLGGYLVGLTYVSKVEAKWSNPSPQPSPARGERARTRRPRSINRYWPAVLVLLPAAYFGMQEAGWL